MQVLGSQLSRVMLLAIEVAVEYWLALTWSPQAQWLNEVAKSGIIQSEVSSLSMGAHSVNTVSSAGRDTSLLLTSRQPPMLRFFRLWSPDYVEDMT